MKNSLAAHTDDPIVHVPSKFGQIIPDSFPSTLGQLLALPEEKIAQLLSYYDVPLSPSPSASDSASSQKRGKQSHAVPSPPSGQSEPIERFPRRIELLRVLMRYLGVRADPFGQ